MANAEAIYTAKNAAPLINPTVATVFTVTDAVAHPTSTASVYIPEYDGYPASNAIATPPVSIYAPLGATLYIARIYGRVSPGTTGNFSVGIQIGNSPVAANNINFVTPAAVSYAAAGHFFISVNLIFDPQSSKLDGTFSGGYGSTFAAISPTAVTGQVVNLAGQKVSLSVTALFGTSNANNVAYLDTFLLEQN